MITTRNVPRTQRLLVAGFVLSVLIHLFGGALWARANHLLARVMQRLPEQHAREQEVATSDVIHLEKRDVPRPAQRSRTRPEPRSVRRPLAHPAPPLTNVTQPDVQPRPERPTAKPAPSIPPEVARRVPRATVRVDKPDVAKVPGAGVAAAAKGQAVKAKSALSPQQLAQLNAQFAHTIAATHVDLATIQKRSEERPVATRRSPLQFAGIQARLQRGEGYIEPITMGQRIGGSMVYYTHYTYMWPDGHLEDDDIPWPFQYPVQHDLFAMHIHLIPLQLPPPGFRLTRPLKPFLAHFLQSRGQG